MKTPPIQVTTQPQRNLRGMRVAFVVAFLAFSVLPKAWSADLFWAGAAPSPSATPPTPAAAGSGTWVNGNPLGIPPQWSTSATLPANTFWTNPNPDVPGGNTAHFVGTNGGNVTLASDISAAGINFDPGASTFTINTNGNALTIQGAGIVNNSGLTQTIINNGAIPGETPINAGRTQFHNGSNAGSATITNAGGAASLTTGGFTVFSNSSNAGSATITNNSGAVTDGFGGLTGFFDTSNAGRATITNNGSAVIGAGAGRTQFHNGSNAGSATITNNGAASAYVGGSTLFFDTSNAGSATITNNGSAVTGGGGGVTQFSVTATAGSARITNSGSAVSGGGGGSTLFFTASTAGDATITNNGAATAGALGGLTEFWDTSNASNATIATNGGTGGGSGGETVFRDRSDGGTARAITNGNGRFDISGLTTAGMGIGSIEGTGNYFLGSKMLMVGGNSLSTTVSGAIQNGGLFGGVDGSLTKVGTGTLTLTGANTYSGGTFLNGGILAVNGDANLGTGALTFNGGTLETLGAGGGLTSSKAISLMVGGGTFLADAGTASTLSGAITGPGAWTKAGAGALILTATSTYTGGTTIGAGTLQLGNGGPTGSIVGDVIDNGILAFNRSTAFTFDGLITGTGGVQQLGTGTTILTRDNTYAGGTSIGPGSTLQLGNGGPTGSIVGDVIDNGTLAFNHSNTFTFGGLISGSGGVMQVGPGTTILTADNTYTGGTSIAPGSTLQLGDGGPTGSVVGPIVDNGTLAVNRSADLLLAGVISGTGNFEQNGPGATTLTAENTYTGSTTVNAGSLIVDGIIGTPLSMVTVNPGGTLGGNGTIRGSVVNDGIVSPGDPIGTLTVTGNYTQAPGGTLRINVAPGGSSLLAVGGQANIAGSSLQLVPMNGFKLQVGQQVTFLTAAGGVNGTFADLTSPFIGGTAVRANVVTLPNAVLFEGTQGSFTAIVSTLAPTPNNLAVAQALDAAAGDPRAAALIAFLNSEPLSSLPHDMELIAPDEGTSMQNIGTSLGNVQASNVGQRLESVRAGSTGFSAAGFTLNGSAPTFSAGLAGVSGPEGKSGPSALAPIPQNRWGVFITGLGEFTSIGSNYNAAGFDVRTGGVTLGADYRVTPYLIVGLTAGYAHTGTDLVENGSLDADGGQFGAYASLFGQGFYLDAALNGGFTSYDSRRTALQGTARGSTDGTDFNALVAGGYDWKFGGLSLGPTARFQYSSVNVDGFTEHGSLAPLRIQDQHVESKRTDFGAKVTYDWKVGGVTIKPELRLAWQHEYGRTEYAVVSGFASGAGTNFRVTGPSVGHDSLLIGAGAAVLWSDRLATYIYYDGELGRANYDAHAVSAGVRLTF